MAEAAKVIQVNKAEDSGYFWSRVQYCPDSTRGDLFTVGVALFDSGRREFLLRHVGKSAILNKMLASAGYAQLSAGELEALCSPVERLVNKFAGDEWTIESLGKAAYFVGLQTKICLSSPLGVHVNDPSRLDVARDEVFRETLGEAVVLPKSNSSKARRPRLSKKYIQRFIADLKDLSPSVEIEEQPTIQVPRIDPEGIQFEFAYSNGVYRPTKMLETRGVEPEEFVSKTASKWFGVALMMSRHGVARLGHNQTVDARLDIVLTNEIPDSGLFDEFKDDFLAAQGGNLVVGNQEGLRTLARGIHPLIDGVAELSPRA